MRVIKAAQNRRIGVKVELATLTTKDGTILYTVTVINTRTGRHYRRWKYDNGIGNAWRTYKNCLKMSA